jgi:hypothetical protein
VASKPEVSSFLNVLSEPSLENIVIEKT